MTDNCATYACDPDLIFHKVVEEMILVPIVQDVANMDFVFALNDVGATIWQQLGTPQTSENLTQAIFSDYEVEPGELGTNVQEFLRDLLEIGAIKEVE